MLTGLKPLTFRSTPHHQLKPAATHQPAIVSLFAEKIDARVRVIGLPVEPVVFKRCKLLKPSTGERAGGRNSIEVPLASGLGVEERGRVLPAEEFERATVEASVEDADALAVFGEEDEDGRRADVVNHGVLARERVERVSLRRAAGLDADEERARGKRLVRVGSIVATRTRCIFCSQSGVSYSPA